jgi:hypothetical protein
MAKEEAYEFEEGQNAVARLLNLVHNPNTDMWYHLLLKFKKAFLKGGAQRQKFTLPSLVFSFLRLASYLDLQGAGSAYEPSADEEVLQLSKADHLKIFKSVNEVILVLQES